MQFRIVERKPAAKKRTCPECGTEIAAACFARHARLCGKEDGDPDLPVFVCPVEDCGRTFNRADNLRLHERTHDRSTWTPCGVEGCNYSRFRPHLLERHRRSHTRAAPAQVLNWTNDELHARYVEEFERALAAEVRADAADQRAEAAEQRAVETERRLAECRLALFAATERVRELEEQLATLRAGAQATKAPPRSPMKGVENRMY